VLLEAIQLRDAHLSRWLVQHWVHRRGLDSLREFQTTTLVSVAGRDAHLWLEALLEPPSPGIPQAKPALSTEEPRPQVEAAFAALAAEFAAPELAAASPAYSAEEVTPPAVVIAEAEATIPAGAVTQVEAIPPAEDGALPAPLFPLPGRLPRLGRLKRLVRGCYEGAIGGFQTIRAGEAVPEAFDLGDPNDSSEADEAISASEPLPQPPFIVEPAAPAEPSAPAEPVAPLPAFHAPGITAVEDAPPAQALAAGQSTAEVRRATASIAFRLPRPGSAGPSQRPAPAPDALADLRAWLPDQGDDLPRAC
jgi:hypothetical protein